jgi:hypothetical protein
LNEKCIGYDRSKSAQRGDESELAKFFAKIEIKRDTAEMFLSMDCGEVALDWQFKRPQHHQNYKDKKRTDHNSFP